MKKKKTMPLTKSEFQHRFVTQTLSVTKKPSGKKTPAHYGTTYYRYSKTKSSIIMEQADDGDLFQKITSHKKKGVYIDEKEAWSIMIQVPNLSKLC